MWWSLSPSCVQCGNMTWPLCPGQWSHYLQLLSFEFRCGGVLLYIRDDLLYNVTSTDPENLELLGFILYNGDSNRVCLYALYSPHSTTHQMSLYEWFLCHIWESAKWYIVSVPCQVIILGLCNNYVWVIIVPHMRICKKQFLCLSGKNSSTTRLVIIHLGK